MTSVTPRACAAAVVRDGADTVVARRAVRSGAVSAAVTTSTAPAASTDTPSTDGTTRGASFSMTMRASWGAASTG